MRLAIDLLQHVLKTEIKFLQNEITQKPIDSLAHHKYYYVQKYVIPWQKQELILSIQIIDCELHSFHVDFGGEESSSSD